MPDILHLGSALAAAYGDTYAWDDEASLMRRWRGTHWSAILKRADISQLHRDVAALIQATNLKLSVAAVEDCISLALPLLVRPFGEEPKGVSFANGTCDFGKMMEGGCPEFALRPHDRADLLTHTIPYPLKQGPRPALDRLCASLFRDPEHRMVCLGHIGMAMRRDNGFSNVPWIYGATRCGKSTFGRLANRLCGQPANRMASGLIFVPDSQEGALQRERLRDQFLVVGDELQRAVIQQEDQFKLMSDHGGISFRAHHVMPDMGPWRPKLLMLSNDIPKFSDRSGAIGERLVMVPAGGTVAASERDKGLLEQLQQECPAIAFECLIHALIITGLGQYPMMPSSCEAYAEIVLAGDTVRAYLDGCENLVCGSQDTHACRRADLYSDYAIWVEAGRRKPIGREDFYLWVGDHADEFGFRSVKIDGNRLIRGCYVATNGNYQEQQGS